MGLVKPEKEAERALKALIYKHNPIINVEALDGFLFSDTCVFLLGKNALLSSVFTIYKTREPQIDSIFELK